MLEFGKCPRRFHTSETADHRVLRMTVSVQIIRPAAGRYQTEIRGSENPDFFLVIICEPVQPYIRQSAIFGHGKYTAVPAAPFCVPFCSENAGKGSDFNLRAALRYIHINGDSEIVFDFYSVWDGRQNFSLCGVKMGVVGIRRNSIGGDFQP